MVRWLVEEGRAEVDSKDRYGRTPLSRAVSDYGNMEMVRWLVKEGGAEVDSKDSDGRTPLDRATNPDVVTLLKNEKWRADCLTLRLSMMENSGV